MTYAFANRLLFLGLISGCQFLFAAYLRAEGTQGQLAAPKVSNDVTIDHVLEWFPPDTQTLIAATAPFKVPVPDPKAVDDLRFERRLENWLLIQWLFPEATEKLANQTVAFAFEGARRFRSPRDLGLMPYDGCHIIVFQQDLGHTEDEWMRSLGAKGARVKELVGQRVVILEEKGGKESWKLFVARPKPNIVLLGTDEEYLKEVLQRMRTKPKDRALADNLPEWKHVDKQARFWAVRHFDTTPKGADPTLASIPVVQPIGVIFTFNPVKDHIVRVKFLSGNKDPRKKIATWTFSEDDLKVKIQQSAPGVLEVEANMDDKKTRSDFDILPAFGHATII